jgi:hypothetical protein
LPFIDADLAARVYPAISFATAATYAAGRRDRADVLARLTLPAGDSKLVLRLAALLADGTLRPVVSHVLQLAAAAGAHRIIESGHAGGKIVLDVADLGSDRRRGHRES